MARPRTQLAALRWVQLVGVSGSSIHTGQNWVERRTTVGGEGEREGESLRSQEAAVRVHLSAWHNTIGFVMSLPPPYKYLYFAKM